MVIAVLSGILAGIGSFTFHYAEGLSYFSTDPRACTNCHIMRPQFASWQKASHHALATCVDCHLPQRGLSKWLAKADNGYRHSKAFTFQDFPEPIRITEGNSRHLQENCLRCHGELVHPMSPGSPSEAGAVRCVHCHRDVGHGPQAGLGGAAKRTPIGP
jgi:cytochrome c nitrite reductase small subunit